MTSLRVSRVVLVLVCALAPAIARAERSTCNVSADGNRFCDAAMPCDGRRSCIGDAGTEDWFCLAADRSMLGVRECMAACTTMFGCEGRMDCPVINGITGSCQRIEASDVTTPGVCTYVSSGAPNQGITYCAPSATGSIATHFIGACHVLPMRAGDPTVYTPDYFRGDCDGDGCANGADSDPCAPPEAGTTCGPVPSPAESPFCPSPPPLACRPTGTGLVCDEARPCTRDGAMCAAGTECEDGWSDGPRCRPECGTIFACAPATGGATGEVCPPFDGMIGACLPVPDPLYPGYGGVCMYGGLSDLSCPSSMLSSACFVDPTTGSATANFFQGDCDTDGVPNGCDPTQCSADGMVSALCDDVPGVGCDAVPPPPDAGVEEDAAVVDADAGNTDGGNTDVDAANEPDASAETDAASVRDAGSSSADAGSSEVDVSGQRFGGGGGCRCGAAGGDRGGLGGIALVALALGAWVARRRR